MLLKLKRKSSSPARGLCFALVVARYNPRLTEALWDSTRKTLVRAGARRIQTFHVPGSYEIPLVAMKLAKSRKYDAILALGVVMQGVTLHAEHITLACSLNLQRASMETGVPIIHQILTPKNLRDARARVRIRGIEAANTAIEMARLISAI